MRVVVGRWSFGDDGVVEPAEGIKGAEGVDTFVIDVRPESDLPSAPVATVRKTAIPADGRVPMIIDWSSGREASQGRPRYQLDVRALGKKGWGKFTTVARTLTRTGTNRMLKPGTYQFRVRTRPTTGEPGVWVVAEPFTVSVLQESDKSIEYQGAWTKLTRNGTWGGQVRRTTRPGDSFRVTVSADGASLIMTAGPAQGIIDVCLDPEAATPGACRTVDLSTLPRGTRRVVTNLRNLPEGEHVIKVTAREAPVELDAIVLVVGAPETLPATPAPSTPPAASPAPAG